MLKCTMALIAEGRAVRPGPEPLEVCTGPLGRRPPPLPAPPGKRGIMRQLCTCTEVSGRDHYAVRCHRCGLSRSYPRRPSYVSPPIRRNLTMSDGRMGDVAALDAALTALPLQWERAGTPAQWRDIDPETLSRDRAYRSWSYRSASWEAAMNAPIAAAHSEAAKRARAALSGNRTARRAAWRLLAPRLPVLRAMFSHESWYNPWETIPARA